MTKLLLVDDNQQNLYLLQVLLSTNGYHIESATNGVEALELAHRTPPDLIISDILMPVMDGFALCRAWKQDKQLQNIPFVFYTATYTDPKDEDFALKLGAERFIIKPLEPDKFLTSLREIIETCKHHRPVIPCPPVEDVVYYKEYNAALIRKLEDKVLQLEKTNRALELDIAERKRAEEERRKLQDQMIQVQKMESIGRLAGGIAHDFNNMLGVIFGCVDLALLKINSSHPLHGYLKEIQTAAQRSAELTRQLLTYARRQPVSRKVLDLNDTLAGILKMLQRLIGEHIELVWNPGRDLWPIKMDPSQVNQIVTNLCVNARDAISGAGWIIIETDNVVVNAASGDYTEVPAPGEYVRLVVRDNGCGMDRETLENLFEPFFTTKGIGKGTGLGLATVYGIVKQNEGDIRVYSEPNRGATFEIYFLRYTAPVEPELTPIPAAPPMHGQETVLLVEDEPQLLELSRMVLESLGYQVFSAKTPGEALQLAETHAGAFHLLMTDLVMPEMNGRELANRIQTSYPHVKSVFTSGYAAEMISSHGVMEEKLHFLQKPYTMDDLAAKVREVLQ